MATSFLDTSAIIKRYFAEQGHIWIGTLYDSVQGHQLHIAQAALVEVVATICRKAREQNLLIAQHDELIDTFRQDIQDIYIIKLVNTDMYTSVGDLCRSHTLRVYDAVQLACVLNLRDETITNEVTPPIFVC